MKTKIKRHSRSVISVLLAVCMLISCMTAAMIATDAAKTDSEAVGYGGGTMTYTVTHDDNTTTTRTSNFTLSNNKGNISMNFTDAKVGENVTCTLLIDSDTFGGGATLTQGDTNWLTRNSGTFTITVTAKATVSFNILEMRPSDNPPSLRFSITDDVPDYYLVGSLWISSGNWTLPGSNHDRDLTYDSSTGLYQKTLTLDAQSSGTDITYVFRVRNKGRNDWAQGSNYNYENLIRPVTDASSLVKSIASDGNDKNIKFTLKSNANVTIGFNEATSKITMIFTPTSCDVTTAVSPAGVGTASVTKSGGGAATGLEPGSFVDLTAASSDATEYVFSKWAANPNLEYADANSATTTAKVTGSAMATAQFTKTKYTVTCDEPSNGTLTIASGVDGSNKAAWGTTVTVTATPASGYALTSVTAVDASSGAVTVTDNATFTMPKSNVTVTATFHQLNNYSVTYGDDGNGYVSVGYQYSDTQDTITQSITNGATDVPENSAVNFCAIPKPGYKFDGWYTAASGGTIISTTQDETVTINGGAVTRYAHFSALDYMPEANKIKLLIAKSAVDDAGEDHGANPLLNYWGGGLTANTAYSIPTTTYYSNINGKSASSNYYLVVLDVTSNDEFKCQVHNNNWTQETKELDKMYKDNTYIIEWSGKGKKEKGANEAYSLPTAVYPITLNVTNAEMGEDTHVKAYATVDTEVTVTADVADSASNKVTVTANSTDVTSTKKFTATTANPNTVTVTYAAKEPCTITLPEVEGGTVTATAGGKQIPDGGTVLEGTEVTFTATPDNGHTFTKWTINGTEYNTATKVYTVNADTTATVTFADKVYEVWWPNSGEKYCDMTKQPNGTYVSNSIMNNDYNFTIKCTTDSTFSHSGAKGENGWYINDLDGTVSEKANARWYSGAPNTQNSYKNNTGSNGYVVYDPNAANKNDNNDQFSHYKGMIWLTTNESDGTYPTIVYLKDGTVRSGYKTTAMNGVTTLEATGTTDGLTASDVTGYGKKTVNSADEYYVKRVIIPYDELVKGVKLHIKTQVIDNQFDPGDASKGNAKDYYVKGFDVNGGLTQAVLNQEFNDNDEATEKADYPDRTKIHGSDPANGQYAWNEFTLELNADNAPDVVEVTPIYFYRSAKSSDTVRFYAEDFVGDVYDAWRGSLAVYPYIENTYDPYGNYPGQLMVNEGGRYMMDIPATYTNGSGVTTNVQGLTMNNFIWDDVHYDLFYPDINSSHKSEANYQTYDFNEFEIINHIFQRDGLDEDIIFTFKYKGEVSKENSNLGQAIYYRDYEGYVQDKTDPNYQKKANGTLEDYDYRTIQPTLSKAQMADSKYKFEDLTDWYHNKVDIMGNLCEDDPDKADYNPIYIISNGYDYSSVGKYATAWAYYRPVNDSGNVVWEGDFDHYELFEVMGGQGNQTDKYESESYLIDPEFSDAIIKKYTNDQGTAKIMDCKNVPCKITYEYEIYQDVSNLKDILDTNPDGEDGNQPAHRSDGRWLYSNSSALLKAHTIVAIVDSTGKIYTRDYFQENNVDYTKGGYNPALNTSIDHSIKAYFTNNGTETVEGREISNTAGHTECNSISDGEHTYDMTTVADPNGEYEFVGWYYYNGTDYKLASESMTYSQEAKSNDTFAAVYKKVSAGNFVVSHTLHKDSTGEADCKLKVEVKDGATAKFTSDTVTNDQVKIGPTYIRYNSTYNLVITLTTDPKNATMSLDDFYKKVNTTTSSILNTGDNPVGATSTVTVTKASWTATITIPIANLFDQEGSEHEQTLKTLPFYSKVSKNHYYYYVKYIFDSRLYDEQYYVAKGELTDEEIETYLTFTNGTPAFTGDKQTFLAAKSPYEDNYKQTITWDFSDADDLTLQNNTPNPNMTSYTSDEQKTFTTSVSATQTDAKTLNVAFSFPYDYTKNDSNPSAVWTFTPTVASGKTYPAYDNDTVLWQQTVDYLERFTLNHVTYKAIEEAKERAKTNPDEVIPEPTFILTPDKVTYPNPEHVAGDDKPETIDKPFNYWSIYTLKDGNKGVEYARCYSKFFNLALYQDSYIEPVYKAENEDGFVNPANLSAVDEKASLGFLENSRNQWNENGGGKLATTKPTWYNKGDRVFSDFVISFDYKGIQLNTCSASAYRAGLIIENVADVDTSSPLTAARQAALLQSQDAGLGADKKAEIINHAINETTSCERGKFLISPFAVSKLDNKNSIEYYYSFANISHSTGNATARKDHIYRAVSYLYDITNNKVVLSDPIYFEIYDMANISQGIATPTT